MTILQLLGLFLFLHDVVDFPKVDRVHHYQVGLLLMKLG